MGAAIFCLVLLAIIFLYAWRLQNGKTQGQMRARVKGQQAAAKICPHCLKQGAVVPASQTANAPKLLLGVFALGMWKTYRCTSCGYRW